MTEDLERRPEGYEDCAWLIYSREHNAYWRPNSAGYTIEVDEAGRYTRPHAEVLSSTRDPQFDGTPSEIIVLAPEAAEALKAAREENERLKGRPCFATISTDPPQDCDAPYCGCNPAWHECIEMLQESGWLNEKQAREAEAENRALREALAHLLEFADSTGQGCAKQVEDARAILMEKPDDE